jgi:zinc/manganese transport system substrate-binding protein
VPLPRRLLLPALLTMTAVSLTACGGGGAADAGGTAEDGPLRIVTATNVYGDIAAMVGGDDVEVTSLVNSLSQDPHSYEATVQDKLTVSEADLVIENGGGYDTFLARLAEETGVDDVLNAVEISGLEEAAGAEAHAEETHDGEEPAGEEHAEDDGHGHGAFNEHVWYDLGAMASLADALAEELGRLDTANADAYRQRADDFTAQLTPLEDRLAAIAGGSAGLEADVAVTEPVPLYLLEDAGLHNVTPEEFTEAIEEESEVPIAVLEEMKELVGGGSLVFLAYNDQTQGSQTEAVRAAAEDADLPVLDFTETMPEGEGYVSWMTSNTDSIEAALGS